jgi:hypothetical protein
METPVIPVEVADRGFLLIKLAMKTIFFLSFFFLNNLPVFSQKHDYIWVLGHNGGTTMDFNSSPLAITFADRDAEMSLTNASICNMTGELLFYTNGCEIFNSVDEVMENGFNLNPGEIHSDYCVPPFSTYPSARSAMVIPKPGDTTLFYLFHQGKRLDLQPIVIAYADKQYYSIIDMSQNNGMGKVMAKNQLMFEDTLWSGDLTAVKHANAIDWWIIVPKAYLNKYYRILLTSAGISEITEQFIGDSTTLGGNGGGQAVFSPDGKRYVRYNPKDGIFVFDFDRETGNLSNFQHVAVAGDSAFVGGAAISPNSRFLYISAETKFFQFDLEAADIAASQILLGEYDGFVSPFATTFFNAQLAPDCRIYVTCFNSANIFHVIHHPDEPGLACGFEQHGVQLATSNAFSIPNFPNYRLGSANPVCDSSIVLSVAGVPLFPAAVQVYPNPASTEVWLSLPAPLFKPGTWRLYNALGQSVHSERLAAGQREAVVSLAGLPAGVYFWRMESGGGMMGSGKLIIAK